MNLIEMRFEHVERIYLAQDRTQWRPLLNTLKNLRDAKKEGNFLTNFSSRIPLNGLVIFFKMGQRRRRRRL
jgi:hypothetical protein